MNKQLIITYFEEFDHWLHNGNDSIHVIFYNTQYKEWDCLLDWNQIWEQDNMDFIPIINDKYVEFRKALAESKTIQVDINYWAFPETDIKNYQDLPKDFTNWNKYEVSCYRIKPEELQFKEGDWIRNNSSDTIFKYTSNMLKPNLSCCEHWKPRPNELCWFWTPTEKKYPKLGKFLCMFGFSYYAKFGDANYSGESNTCCEPFIGTLPTHLKD